MPTYRVITLGCKVNHYESLQVEEVLRAKGYAPAPGDQSDLVVVNTCSITASAAAKSRNLIRRYARQSTQTIAIGCYATSHSEQIREFLPNGCILTHQDDLAAQLDQHLAPVRPDHPPTSRPATARPGTLSLPQLSRRQSLYQRALLKIQDGCDAHCTYCIIPRLRPHLWSRPADEVVAEARRLAEAGHRELVLTGIFLGAYGQQSAIHRRQTSTTKALANLIERLCTQVSSLARLRLSSLEPGDVTVELIAALRSHRQVMPHFHLPLQSGSDAILKRMNRQYRAADYLAMVERLRQAFDRPAFTTDVIVGFPGESDADFHMTLDAARAVGFLHIHAFPFSPREGTPASRWKRVTERTVSERMNALEALSSELSMSYRRQFVGQEANVLVEHPSALDDIACSSAPGDLESSASYRHGRTERYFTVNFPAARDLTGQLVRLRITEVTPTHTIGTPL